MIDDWMKNTNLVYILKCICGWNSTVLQFYLTPEPRRNATNFYIQMNLKIQYGTTRKYNTVLQILEYSCWGFIKSFKVPNKKTVIRRRTTRLPYNSLRLFMRYHQFHDVIFSVLTYLPYHNDCDGHKYEQ